MSRSRRESQFGDRSRETPLSECDTAKLSLVQNSQDHSLCEAGNLERPDLIAREHFGGIAGLPHINCEWTKPFLQPRALAASGFTLLTSASNRQIS